MGIQVSRLAAAPRIASAFEKDMHDPPLVERGIEGFTGQDPTNTASGVAKDSDVRIRTNECRIRRMDAGESPGKRCVGVGKHFGKPEIGCNGWVGYARYYDDCTFCGFYA